MDSYSVEYKRSLVERVALDPGLTLIQLSKDTGVGRATLYRWIKAYGADVAGLQRRAIKPAQWSVGQKIRALLETQNLKSEAVGECLRKNGLFYANLVEWKAEILDEVKKKKMLNTIPANEAAYLRKIRSLEAELKIKENALREAIALIELKKKAELIWPVLEEEKSEQTTEKPPSD